MRPLRSRSPSIPIVEVGKQRTAAAKASQAKIDRLADETASLLSDYKTVMKQVDGLKVYNARLERQIANQESASGISMLRLPKRR